MKFLPLHKNMIDHKGLSSRPPEAHAGLWFDKYCNEWRKGKGGTWTLSNVGGDNPKHDWIRTLVGGKVGSPDLIKEHAFRLIQLVNHRDGKYAIFTTNSRFATGLGRSHPVENGFAWHPTLGTPYLPGSSVKGLALAWARNNMNVEVVQALFGNPNNAGSVCFLDAIPITTVQLEDDIMTPHYAGWDSRKPPGDWMSPTPIPFLTTAKGTSFFFGIVPCRDVISSEDVEKVMDCLHSALQYIGGGAKTAVGYGRFYLNQDECDKWKELSTQKIEERAQRIKEEAMKKTLRDLPDDVAWVTKNIAGERWQDTNFFLNDIEAFLNRLKEKLNIDAYRMLSDEIEKRWQGIMDDPHAVKGKQKKPKYKERQIQLVESLKKFSPDQE